MQHIRPLQDHPEFTIREYSGWTEYRVENWRLARDGSHKVVRGYGWSWLDPLIPLVTAVCWQTISNTRLYSFLYTLLIGTYVYSKCTNVLWESVIVIHSFGIQYETHRGLPGIPLLMSRHFIPLTCLQDFVINEGLHGWNVRYYLAALEQSPHGTISLHVPFENILPHFPVLLEVYQEVQEMVFQRPSGASTDEQPH
ncbi:hypothetical protein PHLGIDRAFT_390456 [Phlebiopsis gigantea 11061_1 CR5-6]|uniref:Phosphatidylinositol N-acetylglucosaminyltransferase subunit H conserved domain-containing protein n=1 Tax=Phlebiopsis gigantea (strain 11061_1 CR5-6) TaxID=745531 RepID=A0A0C3S054_PHLG1|nr:hypothetical protein PHLGIDRAFT_390456 [Phlebiopsis gigantea 11061_1 CR5-6]